MHPKKKTSNTTPSAGSEAARGIHAKQQPDEDKPGSEPLKDRKTEHKGSYGGEGGSPRTSSDQRNSGDVH